MLTSSHINYSPRDGFCAGSGLKFQLNCPDKFECRWSGSCDYGDFRINKIEIRSGFDIWMYDGLMRKDIRFSVDDHPPIFSFSFCLSGKSTAYYNVREQPLRMSAGKQGVFYSPVIRGTSCMSANVPIRQVGIAISPERLSSYLASDPESIHPDLRGILEKKRNDLFCRIHTITPAMRLALEQLINCPFSGITRRLFLESRALELISYQLDQVSDGQALNLADAQFPHPDDRKRIERVREILVGDLEKPPGLGQLAREAGMSHPKLNRCFRRVYGMTVFEYLRAERLNRAKEILHQGMNVTEAAYAVGYESVSHFSQAFKKQFKISPSAFIGRI